jgi:hypothetical protein
LYRHNDLGIDVTPYDKNITTKNIPNPLEIAKRNGGN